VPYTTPECYTKRRGHSIPETGVSPSDDCSLAKTSPIFATTREYSKGMTQKLGLAASLLSRSNSQY
jgi:hypothetical protein